MKTIVAAVDSSDLGQLVFKETLVLAATLRARVKVLSVTPQYEGNMNRFYIEDADQQIDDTFTTILKYASEYAESLGLNLDTVHRKGKPAVEILSFAREVQASLIVLGCSRRSQVERMLLGRTIAEVIANSHCDVMLLPEGSEILFTDILVGINDSSAGREAQKRSFDIATSYGSTLHGLHALDLPAERSLRYGVAEEAEIQASALLKNFADQAASHGLAVVTSMSSSTPAGGLIAYAEEHDINLVVIGADRKKPLLEMLGGSVAERLASLSSCPLLIAEQSLSQEVCRGAFSVFTMDA